MELPPEVKAQIDSVEGWLSDREAAFLYETAGRCQGQNGVVVEIGSFKGKSTVAIGLGLRNANPWIMAIDPHISDLEHRGQGSSLTDFQRNIARAGLANIVTPIVAKSQEAAARWFHPIEFLWIDGDHTYEGAMADFVKYSPHVIDGGIIAFHDATQDEVPKVVVRVFRQQGYGGIGIVDSIVYAHKRSANKSWRDHVMLFMIQHYSDLRRWQIFKPFKNVLKRTLARV